MFLVKQIANLLKKRVGSGTRSRRPDRPRLDLESLEDRLVPSTIPYVSSNGWHTVYVNETVGGGGVATYQVYGTSKGPTDLNFNPLDPAGVSEFGSPANFSSINSPPLIAANNTFVTYQATIETTSEPYNFTLTNPTSIAVSESTSSLIFGQPVTYRATVTSLPDTPAPTAGFVNFYINGALAGSVGLNGSNTASLTLGNNLGNYSAVKGGTNQIRAEYQGLNAYDDSYYQSVMSNPVTQVVAPAATSTSVSESAPSSIHGQAVTLTADVSAQEAGIGIPSGSVNFYDNNQFLGSANLGAVGLNLEGYGVAQIAVSSLPAGSYSLTPVYSGSAHFQTSTSAGISLSIQKANTAATLSDSAAGTVFGQQDTFTVNVSAIAPGAGTPTGVVSFFDNGGLLGTANLVSGQANFSTSSLPAGLNVVTASYGGDANFVGSQAPQQADVSVSLHLSAPNLPAEIAGQNYSTTISAAGGSGSYSFSLVSGAFPSGFTLSSGGVLGGVATLAGTYQFEIKASDRSRAGVTGSQTFTMAVDPGAPAKIDFKSCPSSATAGTAFDITVAATDAYGNNVAGPLTLTSSDGEAMPTNISLGNGTATASIVLDRAGSVTLTATAGAAKGVSNSITVNPGPAVTYRVSPPTGEHAGSAFNIQVTAADRFGNTVSSDDSTATLYCSDGQTVQGSTVTLTKGVGMAHVTLDIADTIYFEAVGGGLSGYSGWTTVAPAALSIVQVSAPSDVTAGVPFEFTVTAKDALATATRAWRP